MNKQADIEKYQGDLAALRRDLHKHPETAFREQRTADIVAGELERLGLEIDRGLATTGVVGTLKAGQGNRVIGLRADMDALFIQENNDFDHRSVHDGKMHACGHDGHTAMLLGAARALAEAPEFDGTVHFIFQPAEESEGGARVMIEEGLFDKFPMDAVYGMHNMPGIEAGRFAIRPGPFMAAGDTWNVTITGAGGHGAIPQDATDTTVAAAQFITAVQTVVSRDVAPRESAVVSVGYIDAGDYNSPNIIPSKVSLRGTARSFSAPVRDILEARIGEIAQHCAQLYGCDIEYYYQRRYPTLVNWAEQTDISVAAAKHVVGGEKVAENVAPAGGSEDFAFMLEKVPGAYILIGNGKGAAHASVHTPTYDFNDDILATGAAYWVALVEEELSAQGET